MRTLDQEVERICAEMDSGKYFVAVEEGKVEFKKWLNECRAQGGIVGGTGKHQ